MKKPYRKALKHIYYSELDLFPPDLVPNGLTKITWTGQLRRTRSML